MKSLIIICLSTLLFLANISIPVFKHICKKEGVFTSYFFNHQNHCQEETEKLPPCCQKEKKNCCHDEKTYLQLDETYTASASLSAPLVSFIEPFTQSFFVFAYTKIQRQCRITKRDDPPFVLKTGRQILLFHQVFRV